MDTKQINSEEKLINSAQAAKRLGYQNKVSFLRAVRYNGIPCVRLNARRVMFDPAGLTAWVRRKTVGGRR